MSVHELDEMSHGVVGAYKMGRFYAETAQGVPGETSVVDIFGVGREVSVMEDGTEFPGGPLKTLRIVTLNHEMSHYVHDLSLGVCLNRHEIIERSASHLLQGLTAQGVEAARLLPLFTAVSQSLRVGATDLHPNVLLHTQRLEQYLQAMWTPPSDVVGHCIELHPAFFHEGPALRSLSTHALLEGLVATKTLKTVMLRARSPADLSYLEAEKKKLGLLPCALGPLYNRAREFYYRHIGPILSTSVDQTNEAWPLRYTNSACSLADYGFMFLADIALHLPPMEMISDRIETGQNNALDFVPAYRFCAAVALVAKAGYFPHDDQRRYPDYYENVFDTTALTQSRPWPTMRETNDAWIEQLERAKTKSGSARHGYALRLVKARAENATRLVIFDPIVACAESAVPVFHLSPRSFSVYAIYHDGRQQYLRPPEPGVHEFDVAQIMAQPAKSWTDTQIDGNDDYHEDRVFVGESDNRASMEREIVRQSFTQALYGGILYNDRMCCPFAKRGCPAARDGCASLQRLEDLPTESCAFRTFLEQSPYAAEKLEWETLS